MWTISNKTRNDFNTTASFIFSSLLCEFNLCAAVSPGLCWEEPTLFQQILNPQGYLSKTKGLRLSAVVLFYKTCPFIYHCYKGYGFCIKNDNWMHVYNCFPFRVDLRQKKGLQPSQIYSHLLKCGDRGVMCRTSFKHDICNFPEKVIKIYIILLSRFDQYVYNFLI